MVYPLPRCDSMLEHGFNRAESANLTAVLTAEGGSPQGLKPLIPERFCGTVETEPFTSQYGIR